MLVTTPESRYMLADLTGVVNQLPNQYGYLNSLNLFTATPTTQHSFILEVEKSDIRLLDAQDSRLSRKADALGSNAARQIAFPLIPYKVVEALTPEEIQGVRQVGTANTPETEQRIRARKLAKIRTSFDITNEFLKAGAIKGRIFDADGTLRLDLFAQFGVTKKTIVIPVADTSATSAIDAAIEELKAYMEDNAGAGTIINGEDITVLVDSAFFAALTSHPYMRDAYLQQQTVLSYQQITGSLRTGRSDGVQARMSEFHYRGVTFVEYRGQFMDNRGKVHKLVESYNTAGDTAITTGVGHAFPNVTSLAGSDLFQIAYAPPFKMGYANTLGQPLYVFEYEKPRDEGIDFEAHSILMPFCTRPQLLVDILAEPRPA